MYGVSLREMASISKAKEDESCRKTLDEFMSILKSRCGSGYKVCTNAHVWTYMNPAVSGKGTLTEPVLVYNCEAGVGFPLIPSEAKRPMHSPLLCLFQGGALGSDIIINMRAAGLPLEDCAVPIVLSAGQSIQIGGVYLLPNHYPVFCTLSRVLSVSSYDDIKELSWWAFHMAKLAKATVAKIPKSIMSKSKGKDLVPELALRLLFLKPVRAQFGSHKSYVSFHRGRVNAMLRIYRLLYGKGFAKYIQFPLGLLQIPRQGHGLHKLITDRIAHTMKPRTNDLKPFTPLMVYKFLDPKEGLTTDNPPQELFKPYMSHLHEAITGCTEVGVVFLDLRPANIMWKPVASGTDVDMRLIDFEDVYVQGWTIRETLVESHKDPDDRRYNVNLYKTEKSGDKVTYYSQTATNEFALQTIKSYFLYIYENNHCSYKHFCNNFLGSV